MYSELPYEVKAQVLQLVADNVAALSSECIGADSPMFGVVHARTHERVGHTLTIVGYPPRDVMGARAEIIIAIDEDAGNGRLAGFLLYKTRAGSPSGCSISYAATREEYRRQGVLRSMMDELASHFSSIGLSCRIETVPVYERLGFYVVKPEGTLVAMENAQLPGSGWDMGNEYYEATKSVQRAKAALRKTFGKNTRLEWAKFDAVQKQEAQRVLEYVQHRLESMPEQA
jgi:GNAT superfamily N-acetyltransferase